MLEPRPSPCLLALCKGWAVHRLLHVRGRKTWRWDLDVALVTPCQRAPSREVPTHPEENTWGRTASAAWAWAQAVTAGKEQSHGRRGLPWVLPSTPRVSPALADWCVVWLMRCQGVWCGDEGCLLRQLLQACLHGLAICCLHFFTKHHPGIFTRDRG